MCDGVGLCGDGGDVEVIGLEGMHYYLSRECSAAGRVTHRVKSETVWVGMGQGGRVCVCGRG